MILPHFATPGAEQIIQRCLGLKPGQNLVIFIDETTVDIGVFLAKNANELDVSPTIILIPIEIQKCIPTEHGLGMPGQAAAKEARAILTCVNGTADCLPFRRYILETQWSARTRIGHMPGTSFEVLQLANVDLNQLISDCHQIEQVMARGHTLEVVSYTSQGVPHYLKVNIDGWERLPVASDGIILDGVWGNTPSGETYIAPVEGSGEGSVVINGSIPGLVIKAGEEIILHFKEGDLIGIEPTESPTAQWLNENQIQIAKNKKDRNWSNLAEIGVGVNPVVETLTGNMLFDEKAAGTVHIALGDNSFMGGRVTSTIHCDMVISQPTMIIDGKSIIDRGQLHIDETDWRENYIHVPLEESPFGTATAITRSGTQVVIGSDDDRLQRILHSEPGRRSTCFVGDDETARLVHKLYEMIPSGNDWLPIKTLAATANLKDELCRQVLHVMWSYDLIKHNS